MARLGVVSEQKEDARVSATPETVGKIIALGYEVVIEKGAGEKSSVWMVMR